MFQRIVPGRTKCHAFESLPPRELAPKLSTFPIWRHSPYAGSADLALTRAGDGRTLFTGNLLRALEFQDGILTDEGRDANRLISFARLRDKTWGLITSKFGASAPYPQLYAPSQVGGDLSALPLLPCLLLPSQQRAPHDQARLAAEARAAEEKRKAEAAARVADEQNRGLRQSAVIAKHHRVNGVATRNSVVLLIILAIIGVATWSGVRGNSALAPTFILAQIVFVGAFIGVLVHRNVNRSAWLETNISSPDRAPSKILLTSTADLSCGSDYGRSNSMVRLT